MCKNRGKVLASPGADLAAAFYIIAGKVNISMEVEGAKTAGGLTGRRRCHHRVSGSGNFVRNRVSASRGNLQLHGEDRR